MCWKRCRLEENQMEDTADLSLNLQHLLLRHVQDIPSYEESTLSYTTSVLQISLSPNGPITWTAKAHLVQRSVSTSDALLGLVAEEKEYLNHMGNQVCLEIFFAIFFFFSSHLALSAVFGLGRRRRVRG